VLSEVGDDQVLEQLEGGPDLQHGPLSSSSMMAGSVMDTIDHTDPEGERVTVSHDASRAARAGVVDAAGDKDRGRSGKSGKGEDK